MMILIIIPVISTQLFIINRLTAPLTSKRCFLYIYSTNIGTEYFKRALYSPFFFSSKCSLFHNANLFGSCIIHILYTGCAKIKKNNSGSKGLMCWHNGHNANYTDNTKIINQIASRQSKRHRRNKKKSHLKAALVIL